MKRKQIITILTFQTILFIIFSTCLPLGITMATPLHNTDYNPDTSQETSPVEINSQGSYTSIQDAINNAQPGSTLTIPAGIYTEILTIQKPLHLKGEGAEKTYISPTSSHNGYAIRIIAEGVTLSGLDITNQGPGLYTTALKITETHTTIQDCTFHDTPIGIALWSSENTILSCDFQRCSDEGIVLLGTATTDCSHNTIQDCSFSENCDGIELQYSTYNLIQECLFTRNTHAGIDAIIRSNNHNTISACEFNQNQGYGIYLAASSFNQIIDCSFIGDSITLLQATETTIQSSTVSTIQLMDRSSLLIKDCEKISESLITSHASTYEIQPSIQIETTHEKNTIKSTQHTFLSTLLSRLSEIKSIYKQRLESHIQ